MGKKVCMKIAALQMAIRAQGGASAELCANTGRCSSEENRAGEQTKGQDSKLSIGLVVLGQITAWYTSQTLIELRYNWMETMGGLQGEEMGNLFTYSQDQQ